MKKFILAIVFCAAFSIASATTTCNFSNCLKEGDGSAKKVLAVYIDVEPEKREAFLTIMLDLLESTQAEEGCLEYTLWSDFKSPNSFFLYEEYKDDEAFKKHGASEHFKEFASRKEALGGVKMRIKEMNVSSASLSAKKKKSQ